MAYIKIPLTPGVFKDDSPLKARGFFVDTDKARAYANGMESMPGWEKASQDQFLGIARGMHQWADADLLPHTFFGTHLRAYSYSDAQINDITPAESYGELTNPFDTTDTDETVNVNHTAHGLEDNQKVRFSNASAVGGITIDGEYVVTYVDADNYTIEHSSAATSTVSGGGGTVDYIYFLAPGAEDSIGGLGFGTGTFGSGTFGDSSASILSARIYFGDNWGENLVFNPQGGGIYEFNPSGDAYSSSPTERVTNGGFATDSDWTKGTNWAIGSGVATASTASADLEQNLTLEPGAWYLLDFDVTAFTSGTVQPFWGSTAIAATIGATGTYKYEFYAGAGGTQALKFTGASAVLSIDNVSVKQLTYGAILPNAPTAADFIFVTEERILVAGGTSTNRLLVQWSDQENNQTWTATASNTAGDYTLAVGTRCVCGIKARGENLIFTDAALYSMRFVPDPTVVYSFRMVASIGCVGRQAAIATDDGVYWMAPGGEFYEYRGSIPRPLMSTVKRYVFDNLDFVQQDKIVAFRNIAKNEVGWLYPSQQDTGNEVSRYVLYNTIDRKWSVGTFTRTAWIDRTTEQFPMACDADGYIYFQEKGFSDEGGTLSGSMTTAYMDFGDGESDMLLDGVIPDFEDLQGGVNMTVYAKDAPGGVARSYGPVGITGSSAHVSVRLRGRSFQFKFEWADSPSFVRLGAIRADFRPIGQRRPAA